MEKYEGIGDVHGSARVVHDVPYTVEGHDRYKEGVSQSGDFEVQTGKGSIAGVLDLGEDPLSTVMLLGGPPPFILDMKDRGLRLKFKFTDIETGEIQGMSSFYRE